jgi:2-methylcitrate dehydratase
MVAIGLIFGDLTAAHYEDEIAADLRIDRLREKMITVENKQFSIDYLDPEKRSIANAIQIRFKDGSATDKVVCEYPIGHRRRRNEGIPKLIEKFERSIKTRFPAKQSANILDLCLDEQRFAAASVTDFMKLLVI